MLGPWIRELVLGQFWKLVVFSVRETEIFSHRGRIYKFIDHECVDSIPTWNLSKHTFMTHQNPVLMHDDAIPWVGIQQVSLKSCRRWDSMYHRIMTVS